MDYVELNRTFVDVQDDESENDFHALFAAELRREGGKTWPDVLQRRFVLILGTAGVGKTTELKHQAKHLTAGGQHAFFLRLDEIAKSDIRMSLNGEDRPRFDAWLASGDEAVFFLDSVDESKLESYGNFNLALRKFVVAVDPAAARVSVVLSCRLSDWRHVTDLDIVKSELFPLAQAKRAAAAAPAAASTIAGSAATDDVASVTPAGDNDGERPARRFLSRRRRVTSIGLSHTGPNTRKLDHCGT